MALEPRASGRGFRAKSGDRVALSRVIRVP